MNEVLLHTLSAVTEEEQALLEGGPLRMEDYGGQDRVDRRKMLPDRQIITLRPHTRFAPFPMHTHNYVELLWQIQGHTVHTMGDGSVIDLKAGELLLFAAGASHAIARADREDIAVNFLVLPEFFDVALEMIGQDNVLGRFLIDTLREQTPDVGYFHFQVSGVTSIQLVLESMVQGLVEPESSSRRIDQTTMGLLFLHLLRHTQALTVPESRPRHMLILEALGEIEDHYQSANFSAIAKKHGVSPTYLSRLVRQATGKSCLELLQNRRLEKASQLLRGTRLSVAEVAQAVGYDNTSYFYRLFKSRFGVRPAQYRSTP